ncbi:lysozyme inhibitor LprI family protein [Bradyrhizobium sp. GCM10023182]|uniref:Lysozyme inhibitor LprI family protein n=1 Tax=Bradyrhizobium zhengyangense TaxID=2911009 RepID=A0ABS9LW35_9BRAD|nr:lysozyme inhibitor LprI family protein [Bradyrhizobium zhengyangense]MCG2671236.1 lysozyme inhibitor LprI family protein [Bradyrhizobium zhengyangense]
MSRPVRLALLAAALLSSATADAMDDFMRASSSGPLAMTFCAKNSDGSKIEGGASKFCKANGYDKHVAAVEASFAAAIAKAPANVRPLFKRDQVWFNEMIQEAAYTVEEADEAELRQNMTNVLRQRATVLDDLARGFGRSGLTGGWANAFGGITVAATETGSYRLDAELNSDYGSDKHWHCTLTANVKAGADGWLAGVTVPTQPSEPGAKPADPISIKLRRQGDTLRVVILASEEQWSFSNDPDCDRLGQVTGTYFASAKQNGTDKIDTAFVSPTFDCTRPETATDEEICADPDLAANDQRLNRAWKALLPRLDEATRRGLTDDQRHWVSAQSLQYPEFLHPAWEKQTSAMHYTVFGRDRLDSLQRERIALLEGFDDKRAGLAGTWLAYNAVIRITVDKDGSVDAQGWKWSQADWKGGCDYEISGDIKGGTFQSSEQRKNPDTLERDHGMLVVNRLDDVFARKREGKNDNADDEAKCKRNTTISSTARLFPAKPSEDIDKPTSAIR